MLRFLHYQRQLPTTVTLCGRAFPAVEDKSRYLSVIRASGCETIVINQPALNNSDQNVSQ
jgi:hypothetical protein